MAYRYATLGVFSLSVYIVCPEFTKLQIVTYIHALVTITR